MHWTNHHREATIPVMNEPLSDIILSQEPMVRMSIFFGVFALVAVAEAVLPRRRRDFSRLARWPSNIGIVVLNTVVLRLVFPVAAMGLALAAEDNGWGLLNMWALPPWLAVVITIVAMDCAIYLQHVMVHAVPVLWRLHRMHHADQDFDVTTGARFHPLEILLSMVIKLAVVAALGPPALGVLLFEVLLNATAMFNHGNLKLPVGLDRVLRLVIVTPDMHRVHHSAIAAETNSNFGFNMPWWDRLFGTYRAQPEAGHEAMTIGLVEFREPVDQRLDKMLLQPFKGAVGDYPINRR
jgi:sterol desaturase/sphingolipid hydroxylase (fatty acid hydroxylase superfamily)